MAIPLKDIAERLGAQVVGEASILIEGVAPLDEAKPGEISFISNPKYEKKVAFTQASVLITQKVFENVSKTFLIVKDPYFSFAQLLAFFYPPKRMPVGVHHKAYVEENVTLGEAVSIGPNATIEAGVVIGNRVQIGAGVFIGAGSRIGADSLVYPNVSIREGVEIGERVIIHCGAVIGSDGFGFAFHQGKYHKIPQVGSVVIADDVEIGANVTIDRGALGKTELGRGTKLDNQVHVGHNVKVGSDTILVAQVGISGSVTIGNHVTLAGQVGVVGHLSIGDNVVAAAKTGVSKDVADGEMISGFPHFSHKQWLKSQVVFQHLPALKTHLKSLSGEVAQLKKELEALKKKKGTSL